MARRQIIAKKNKPIRISKSEQYLVNFKYLGDEPSPLTVFSESEYIKALNWYNYMCTIDNAREYINEYLKLNNRLSDIKNLSKIPDIKISTTAGWIARMCVRGSDIPQNYFDFFEKKLTEAFLSIKNNNVKEEKSVEQVSVQDRMKERASDIIAEIESIIDNEDSFSLYEWMKKNQIPASYSSTIISHYKPWLDELNDAIQSSDKQIKEAYSKYSKTALKKRYECIKSILDDAAKYSDVAKKTKMPSKPRPVSVEKILKGLKYQKEDKNFKIASINPQKIIGAQELWTFNTKYKYITVFRAIDSGGLSIKGTSIINFDEKTSISKLTGRKSSEIVSQIPSSGKIILKKLLDELKNATFTSRINENTILLKIA